MTALTAMMHAVGTDLRHARPARSPRSTACEAEHDVDVWERAPRRRRPEALRERARGPTRC